MGMVNDMNKLSEDIYASYKQRAADVAQRLKDNADLVKEVQKMLDGFRKDHMEMAATLKTHADNLHSALDKGQKDRKHSFNLMMNGIRESIGQIQGEVEDIKISTVGLLGDFLASHETMTKKLHEDLMKDGASRSHWNTGRMKAFDKLMRNINAEITKVQGEVSDVRKFTDELLRKFQDKRSDMSAALSAELKSNLSKRIEYTQSLLREFGKKLAEAYKANRDMAEDLRRELQKSRNDLSMDDTVRLKDFDVVFGNIRKKVQSIQKNVKRFLDDLSSERQQAAATWAKLAASVAKLSEGNVIASPQKVAEPQGAKKNVRPYTKRIQDKKGKADLKEEAKNSNRKESVVHVEKTVEEKPPREITLEEKVLQYIESHKKGVRVSDMEKPFGQTRMRLGFIAKKLLDEGKVIKIENSYYPKPVK